MLGRNGRDFTSAAEVERLEPLGTRAPAGARVSTAFLAQRRAQRRDGSVALSRLTMMRFSGLHRAPRLLVVHQAIHVTAARRRAVGDGSACPAASRISGAISSAPPGSTAWTACPGGWPRPRA